MAAEVRPAGKSGRPWYLVLALLICSGLGAFGATSGWETIEIYRGASVDFTHGLGREEDRASVQAGGDRMLEAMDAERSRMFPLAAAELVLGVSMFVFAAAAMMGRGGARRILVQLTIAQTALAISTFFLAPRTRWALLELKVAQVEAAQLEGGTRPEVVEQQMPILRAFSRGMSVAQLAVQAGITALIVVALTRQRARAFYDTQSERPTEG
jgi:hypothetical protein